MSVWDIPPKEGQPQKSAPDAVSDFFAQVLEPTGPAKPMVPEKPEEPPKPRKERIRDNVQKYGELAERHAAEKEITVPDVEEYKRIDADIDAIKAIEKAVREAYEDQILAEIAERCEAAGLPATTKELEQRKDDMRANALAFVRMKHQLAASNGEWDKKSFPVNGGIVTLVQKETREVTDPVSFLQAVLDAEPELVTRVVSISNAKVHKSLGQTVNYPGVERVISETVAFKGS